MPETTNMQRAFRIEAAVQRYAKDHEALDHDDLTGLQGEELFDTLTDMIADLSHLANRAGLDVQRIREVAEMHYAEELGDEIKPISMAAKDAEARHGRAFVVCSCGCGATKPDDGRCECGQDIGHD